MASPTSSRTAPHPCCLWQEVPEGGFGWTGPTGHPSSVPLQWSASPTSQEALIPLTKRVGAGAGAGEGEGIWSRKRNPGDEPGEARLQSRPQLLLICGVSPRRWGRDEEGPSSGRLDSQQKRCFLSPLTPDHRSASIREQETESEVAQLCPTLCDPTDCSLPGFSIHRVFQARVLEWVAISFSRGSS